MPGRRTTIGMDAIALRFPTLWDVLIGPIIALASVFTNTGKSVVVDRIRGLNTEPRYVGWGNGAGVAAATDTDLFTPAAEARVLGTSSAVTTAQSGDTYQVVATLISASGQTITNVAQFTAATAGQIFTKADHTGVTLANGEGIQYTLKLQFS